MSCEKLSAILIVKNEEKNIVRCLESLHFADEIIVVDSGSTDNTISMAKSFPHVQLIQTPWLGFSENKRIAVQHASHNWIFWIDADEQAPTELAQEWRQMAISLTNQQSVAGIDVARKTFFMGRWVKHSGWYPNRVIRFFHKEKADFNDNTLHEGIVINQTYKIIHFKTDLLHYSYTSLYQYFDKMNRYGLPGAIQLQHKNRLFALPRLVFEPLWTFIRFYFLKKGFLDGSIGLIVCMGAAFSNFIKYTNYFFLKQDGSVTTDTKKDHP